MGPLLGRCYTARPAQRNTSGRSPFPEEQLAPKGVVRLPRELEGLERHTEEARRFLEREARDSDETGSACVFDRVLRIGLRDGEEEVVGELGQMSLALGPVQRIEDLRGAPVQPAAGPRWDRVIQRVPDERVSEA